MKKTLTTKLLTLFMALVLMVTAIPMGNVTAEAAVKPGAVSSVKVSKITEKSAKVTYKKAKKAKGYQIRVYKGKKQVLNKKTKALSYTVKKLQANTKYTVKVRAYNGKKYGKEKTVKFRTKKPANTPAPTNETEEPSSEEPNSGVVMPGESTSTGDALIAEYNAYVAYEAEQWKNAPGNNTVLERGPHGEWDLIPWSTQLGHMGAGIQYNEAYNDKYSMFKYKAGTANAVLDHTVDILNALGCNAERHDVANDAVRFPEMAIGIQYTTTGGIAFDAPNGERLVVTINKEFNSCLIYSLTGREESYTFVANCPDCGKEMKIYIPKSQMTSTLQTAWSRGMYVSTSMSYENGIDLNGTMGFTCNCKNNRLKTHWFKLPYTVNDLATMPWITELTELVATTE